MSVPDLANVPTTTEQLAWFSFAHADLHVRTNTYIRGAFGILLPSYILDPIDTSRNSAWDDNHLIMHNNTDAILGVSGYDISEVDWSDRESIPGWIWLHYQLHYAEAQASGVW